MSVTMRFGNLSEAAPVPTSALQARIRAAVRRCIADEIERLVDVLDGLEVDADFEIEPDLEETGDDEPSLGWPNPGGDQSALRNMAFGFKFGSLSDDRELDEAEGRLMDAGDEREADTCPCS